MAAALDRIVSGLRGGQDQPGTAEKALLTKLDQFDREGLLWRDASIGQGKAEEWLTNYHGKRYKNAPKFAANIVRPTLDRRNALLTENKPSAKIMPWRDGLQAAATILEQLFDANWHACGMQLSIEEVAQMSAVLGSAGIDAAWNKGAHFGEGDFDPVVLDPRQVGFDPYVRRARQLDKAQYIWVETVKNLWEIQREYPGRGMLVKADRSVSTISGDHQQSSVIAELNRSFKARMQKLEDGPVPRKICREYWVRDPAPDGKGGLKFPRGRQIERAGQVVLADGENPYWDGEWPIVWFDLQGDIDSPWGRSSVEALRYIADSINRIGNGFVENTILGGNLVVVTDADALSSETRTRLTNAAALVVPKKFGRTVDYRPPPPMPPHMLAFIQFALRFVDYLVGLNDGQLEGKGRLELRSGTQLEGLQNASQVLIRASARRLEDFLERLGQKWISRVFQFMTGPRLMHFVGNDEQYRSWTFEYGKLQEVFQNMIREEGGDPSKTESLQEMMGTAWRRFAFKIAPLSSIAANKIARAQMLMQLVATGRFPMEMLLHELGFEAATDLIQKAQQETLQYGPLNPPGKQTKQK